MSSFSARTVPTDEAEAGSLYSGTVPRADSGRTQADNATGCRQDSTPVRAETTASNGRSVVDFISEDDVRRAIQKGEKIYINAKTIITPAARDIGEPAEVFVKT